MAAKVTTESDGQFLQMHNVFGGTFVATEVTETAGVLMADITGCSLEIHPVNAVATTETLSYGPGIVACAWQANDLDAHRASCFLSDQDAGTITFSENETGAIEGFVWILRGGANSN